MATRRKVRRNGIRADRRQRNATESRARQLGAGGGGEGTFFSPSALRALERQAGGGPGDAAARVARATGGRVTGRESRGGATIGKRGSGSES